MKRLSVLGTLFGAVLCAAPVSLQLSPVGAAVKSPPFAATLMWAARITAKVIPAKRRSQRGFFIRRSSPRQAQLHRAFLKPGTICENAKKIWRFWSAIAPFSKYSDDLDDVARPDMIANVTTASVRQQPISVIMGRVER